MNARTSRNAWGPVPLRFDPSSTFRSSKHPLQERNLLLLALASLRTPPVVRDLRLTVSPRLLRLSCTCFRGLLGNSWSVRRFKARAARLNQRCSPLRLLEVLIASSVPCGLRASKRRFLSLLYCFSLLHYASPLRVFTTFHSINGSQLTGKFRSVDFLTTFYTFPGS